MLSVFCGFCFQMLAIFGSIKQRWEKCIFTWVGMAKAVYGTCRNESNHYQDNLPLALRRPKSLTINLHIFKLFHGAWSNHNQLSHFWHFKQPGKFAQQNHLTFSCHIQCFHLPVNASVSSSSSETERHKILSFMKICIITPYTEPYSWQSNHTFKMVWTCGSWCDLWGDVPALIDTEFFH